MDKKLFWKILVGCSLALIALFSISTSILISFVSFIQPFFIPIIVGMAVLGALLSIAGFVRHIHNRKSAAPAPPSVHENPLAFFSRAEFWGMVLLVAVLPTYFLCKQYMRPKTHPAPKPPQPVPVVVQEVKFPPLKVSGIVYNGDRSTAVINGRTVQVREMIEGVRVISIKPGAVTVELGGITKEIPAGE